MQIYLKPYPHSTYSNVPYAFSDKREDGTQNFGFFDVKKYPGLIKKIPELKDEPILTKFVIDINKESCFATSGCGIYKQEYGTNQTYWSFVNLHFADFELNKIESNYIDLVGRFLIAYSEVDLKFENAIIEFILNPTTFHDMAKFKKGIAPSEKTILFQGWSLNVKVLGIGVEGENAEGLWKIGLHNIEQFLVGEKI